MVRDMRLYLMKHGRFIFNGSILHFFREYDKTYHVDNIMYLITHPEGNVVVDTGFNEKSISDSGLYAVVGSPEELDVTKGLRCYFDKEKGDILAQLARLGYKPEDIKYVVNSHLHDSTCGGNAYFPHSTFLVQRREMQDAMCPLPPFKGWYNRANFDIPSLNYKLIEGDYDIYGDGKIILLHTPGHTPGHQSILVRLPKSDTIIVAISTAYIKANMERGELTGYYHNAEDQWRSVNRLKEIYERKNALVIADHDPNADKLYKFAPEYYD